MRSDLVIPIVDCEEHSEYREATITQIHKMKNGKYFFITSIFDSGTTTRKGLGVGDKIIYKIVKKIIDERSFTSIEF